MAYAGQTGGRALNRFLVNNGLINTLDSTTATITTLDAGTIEAGDLQAADATIVDLSATTLNVTSEIVGETITTTDASMTVLNTGTHTSGIINSATGNITRLTTTSGFLTNADVTNLVATNSNVTSAIIGTITSNGLLVNGNIEFTGSISGNVEAEAQENIEQRIAANEDAVDNIQTELSGRVFTNEGDITDISQRLFDSQDQDDTDISDVSGRVFINEGDITDISQRLFDSQDQDDTDLSDVSGRVLNLETFTTEISNTYLRLDGGTMSGTLGIGMDISDVSNVLEVSGNARVYGDMRVDGSLNIGPATVTLFEENGKLMMQRSNGTGMMFDFTRDDGNPTMKPIQRAGITSKQKVLIDNEVDNEQPQLNLETDGRIGISVRDPSGSLHVSGDTYITQGKLRIGSNTEPSYDLDISGTLRSINSAYLASSGGSVGIGTDDPSGKLHISGGDLIIETQKSQNPSIFLIRDDTGGAKYGVDSYPDWKITNNQNKFEIDAGYTPFTNMIDRTILSMDGTTQRVGINTSDPSNSLHVIGTFKTSSNATVGGTLDVTGITTINNDTDTAQQNNAAFNVEGGAQIKKSARIGYTYSSSDGLLLGQPYGGSKSTIQAISSGNGSNNLYVNPIGGNVGIGTTTTPTTTLDVNGTAYIADTTTIQNGLNIRQQGLTHSVNYFNMSLSGSGYYNMDFKSPFGKGNGNNAAGSKMHIRTIDASDIETVHMSCNVNRTTSINTDTVPTDVALLIGEGDTRFVDDVFVMGNVGIGTTSPTAKLHVEGNGYISDDFKIASGKSLYVGGPTNTTDGIRLHYSSNSAYMDFNGSGNLHFRTSDVNGGTTRMVLTEAGNLGIGNLSPTTTLDVTGTFNTSSNATIGGTLDVTGNTTLEGDTRLYLGGPPDTGTNLSGGAFHYYTSGGASDQGLYIDSGGGNIFFRTSDVNVNPTDSRLYIDKDGNVGIGKTTPTTTLDVAGTFNTTSNATIGGTLDVTSCEALIGNGDNGVIRMITVNNKSYIQSGEDSTSASAQPLIFGKYASNTQETMTLDIQNRRVGIGTQSPGTTLHVDGTTTLKNEVNIRNGVLTGTAQNKQLSFTFADTTDYPHFITSTHKAGGLGNRLLFYTNPGLQSPSTVADCSLALCLKDGTAGVATDSPTTTLDVAGTFNASGNATVGGTLDVTGNTTLDGNATVGGTLGVTGNTTLDSNATVGGTLGVSGNTTIDGNVGIGRTPIKGYPLEVSGSVYIEIPNNTPVGGTTYQPPPTSVFRSWYNGTPGANVMTFNIDLDSRNDNLNPDTRVFFKTGRGGTDLGQIPQTAMTIDAGNVGIGTITPAVPLEVNTSSSITVSNFRYFNSSTSSSTVSTSQSQATSIKTSNNILTNTAFVATSDKRIKNNILDISDNEALKTFRKLQPKTYEYVDKIRKGNHRVFGFIAQEVREIIPNSVSIVTDIVPDYYNKVSFDTSGDTLILEPEEPYDISNGTKIRVYIQDTSGIIHTVEKSVSISEYISLSNTNEYDISDVFLYGKEVDDFHTLNKDAIWTVATAALQEVDRTVEKLRKKDHTIRGMITLSNSTATVDLPLEESEFTNPQIFLQNNEGWSQIKGSLSGNTLTITARDTDCNDNIDYMVVVDLLE